MQKVFDAGTVQGGADRWQYATGLQYLFQNAAFPADTVLEINAPMAKGDLSSFMSGATGVKKLVLTGNHADNPVTFRQVFYRNPDIEVADFSGFGTCKVERLNSIAQQATALREIIGEFDFTDCVEINNPFTSAPALVEFRIKEATLALTVSFSHSPLLSDATIQSVIEGLANLAGQTTKTVTFHASVGARLTEEQKAAITAKNWTLAY